jgi:selenide,water dikinase
VAAASGVTLEIDATSVPLMEGVLELANRNRTGGGATNLEHFGKGVEGPPGLDEELRTLLYDPQTSGGLFAAIAPAAADDALAFLRGGGVTAWIIGQVREPARPPVRILLV